MLDTFIDNDANKRDEAVTAAIEAIEARILFWTGVENALKITVENALKITVENDL